MRLRCVVRSECCTPPDACMRRHRLNRCFGRRCRSSLRVICARIGPSLTCTVETTPTRRASASAKATDLARCIRRLASMRNVARGRPEECQPFVSATIGADVCQRAGAVASCRETEVAAAQWLTESHAVSLCVFDAPRTTIWQHFRQQIGAGHLGSLPATQARQDVMAPRASRRRERQG